MTRFAFSYIPKRPNAGSIHIAIDGRSQEVPNHDFGHFRPSGQHADGAFDWQCMTSDWCSRVVVGLNGTIITTRSVLGGLEEGNREGHSPGRHFVGGHIGLDIPQTLRVRTVIQMLECTVNVMATLTRLGGIACTKCIDVAYCCGLLLNVS